MRNDPQSGRGQGHVTYFLNFGTSDSITFKRMKLDPSFFLCWIGHGKYHGKDDEWPQRGRGQGHVSYFWSNGTDTHVPQNVFLVAIVSSYCYYYHVLGWAFSNKDSRVFYITSLWVEAPSNALTKTKAICSVGSGTWHLSDYKDLMYSAACRQWKF